MIGRRNLLVGAASLAVFAAARARAEQPILTDDGLYKQSWFLESFLDLADDLEGARKEGKRFAIMWELRGCPYCKETHLVNFAQPRISDYVRANFEVLQLNIIGSRKVTDFDGQELSEKADGRQIRRALHADVPVFRRRGAERLAAGQARGQPGVRLHAARTIFSRCFAT